MAGGITKQLLVLGRGKMAVNVGSFFLQQGWAVTWVVGGDGGVSELEKQVGKIVRRLVRVQGGDPAAFQARVCAAETRSLEKPGLVIECVQEDAKKKQRALAAVESLLDEQTLLWSTSSSILPQQIHRRALGVHFFYPLELIHMVEVVLPANCAPEIKQRTLQLLQQLNRPYLVQQGEQAFAVNRLLLPLQAELFFDLAAGCGPDEVDACSASSLLPLGQLAFMDGVGLDVVLASVGNYLDRMTEEEASSYGSLRRQLARIVKRGNTGKKAGRGLLCGERVRWGEHPRRLSAADLDALKTKYLHLFINSCLAAVDREMVSETALQTVLSQVYQSDASFFEVVRTEDPHRVYKTVETQYRETGRAYFVPSGGLRDAK